MYYSANNAATGDHCLGVATSSAPAGPFTSTPTPFLCMPPGEVNPRDRLAELTQSVLPVDQRRLALTRVFLAFYAEAATVEAAREELGGYLGRWRAVVLEAVGDAQAAGLVASDLDPVRLTFHLVGLTDGLAIQAVVDETVLARLHAHTDIGRELVDVAIGKELE